MPTILNGKYTLGRELGTGASCKVRLAKDQTNKRYAAKLFKSDFNFEKLMKTELATMKILKHPGIIKI